MTKKNFDFLLIFILSLLFGVLILMFSSLILIYDFDFYREEAINNNVYQSFNNLSYADSAYSNLVNYFNGKEGLSSIYSETEVLHLADVKLIVNKLHYLFYFLVFLFVILLYKLWNNDYKYFGDIFIGGFLFVLLFVLFLLVFSLFNFSILFDNFHKIFFSNNYWMLNENSILIKLFPEGFFVDSLNKILLNSTLLGLLSLFIGFHLKKN